MPRATQGEIATTLDTMTLAQMRNFVRGLSEDNELDTNHDNGNDEFRNAYTDFPDSDVVNVLGHAGAAYIVETDLVNFSTANQFMIFVSRKMYDIQELVHGYDANDNTKNFHSKAFILNNCRLIVKWTAPGTYWNYRIQYREAYDEPPPPPPPEEEEEEEAIAFPEFGRTNDHIYSIVETLIENERLQYRFDVVETAPEGFVIENKRILFADMLVPDIVMGTETSITNALSSWLEHGEEYRYNIKYDLKRISDDAVMIDLYYSLIYTMTTPDLIVEPPPPPPPPEAIAFPEAVISNLRITNIISTLLDAATLRYNFRVESAFLTGFTIISKYIEIDGNQILIANNSSNRTIELNHFLEYDTAYGKFAVYRLRRLSDNVISPITYRTTQYDFRTARAPYVPPVIIIPDVSDVFGWFWSLFNTNRGGNGRQWRNRWR